jgi:hypothetical protein
MRELPSMHSAIVSAAVNKDTEKYKRRLYQKNEQEVAASRVKRVANEIGLLEKMNKKMVADLKRKVAGMDFGQELKADVVVKLITSVEGDVSKGTAANSFNSAAERIVDRIAPFSIP